MDSTLMSYLNLFDGVDTRQISNVALLVGIMLSIGALTTVPRRFRWVFHAYSLLYISFSAILTWTYFYHDARQEWQVWPPHLALIIVVDVLMFVRIVRCLWITNYVWRHAIKDPTEDDSVYH